MFQITALEVVFKSQKAAVIQKIWKTQNPASYVLFFEKHRIYQAYRKQKEMICNG